MHQILLYLLRCSKALVPEEEIANMLQWEELEWQKYAEECKGMIVTNPGTVRPAPAQPGLGTSLLPLSGCFTQRVAACDMFAVAACDMLAVEKTLQFGHILFICLKICMCVCVCVCVCVWC